MPREFTADWVTWHDARWRELLAPFIGRAGLQFLEIGAYEGRSACWWLDNVLADATSVLHVIDQWHDANERSKRYNVNLEPYHAIGKVVTHRGPSRLILPTLPLAGFDFAYIDGSHEAADVLLDALLCLPLMKRGGIMLFDDYEWTGPARHHPPKPGIDSFLSVCDWQLEIVNSGYQVALRKIRDR